jgi:hypothetical protein
MSKMLVLILHSLTHFDGVVSRWHEDGVPALTVIDCVGTRGITEQGSRDDLPLLPRIRDLLQSDDAPRKIVMSIVPDDLVDRLVDGTQEVLGDLSVPGNGILAVLPVERIVGMRERPREG